jgi:hypothetical protein
MVTGGTTRLCFRNLVENRGQLNTTLNLDLNLNSVPSESGVVSMLLDLEIEESNVEDIGKDVRYVRIRLTKLGDWEYRHLEDENTILKHSS